MHGVACNMAGALFDTVGALFGTGTKSLVLEDLPGTKLGSGQSGKVSRIFSARIEDGCWIFQLSHISMTRLSQF